MGLHPRFNGQTENRFAWDRQGFMRLNGVLLSMHTDEDGPHLRGSLWQLNPDAADYIPVRQLIPCAKVQPPLLGVRGRAGWSVRVELADAEALIARQLPVII
jgi:hypothetical protein